MMVANLGQLSESPMSNQQSIGVPRRVWAALVLVMVTALLSGCGGGGSDGPTGGTSVASVRLSASSLSILIGQTDQLNATPKDAQGNTVAGAPAATWTSSNNPVATVSSSGLIAGVTVGTADITATISGKSASASVTVVSAATEATVTMPGNTFAPFRTSIKQGGKVHFVFPSLSHNVIFEQVPGAPQNIPETTNATVTLVFGTVRVYGYLCSLHSGMAGEINVVP